MIGFSSFDDYLSLPRVSDLALSVDGTRLVATIATLDEDGQKFVSALWEIDPAGITAARRLTRSDKGENSPAFLPDGALLFVSGREGEDDEPPALWRLPVSGEASRVLTRPGGVAGVRVARAAGTVALGSAAFAGTVGADDDAGRRQARKDVKTSAILHTTSPVRYWDHDLGPDEVRLYAVDGLNGESTEALEPVDLTPQPARALDEAEFTITPDGRTVLTAWFVLDSAGLPRGQLRGIDTGTGEHRVLADDPEFSFSSPSASPDGSRVVCVRERETTYDRGPMNSLWLIDIGTGQGQELVADPDIWPESPQFSPDGSAVFFRAAAFGHHPVFRLDTTSGDITRLTATGHYTNLVVAPDGETLYALRDAVDSPPRPVRLSAGTADQEPTTLPAPGAVDLPGHLERLSTTAADGATVEAWLVRPPGSDATTPAPLLLWIHGGPLGSWNGWSWRWNPWLMTAKGYAVLLPDPALSVGYGATMIDRGWGQWGGAPYTDLMAITDAVLERPDIDATRTAAMGGSYGGYMANWVAGHTDRFRCIVTHASLWSMDQFHGTTDVPGYWAKEWGLPAERPERYARWSPNHFVDQISTPMLVIHGDKDYRVPIGEGLRLWWDLQRTGVESQYLYFPDEGHWVLKPGNARVWYQTVWAWLAQYVLDEPWTRPALV